MKAFYTLLIAIVFSAVTAQEKIQEGSFKNLAAITAYNVVFDYTGMEIHGYKTEEEFLADKMNKREGEKSEDFRRHWFEDRENNYEPKFIAYFNERMAGKGVAVGKNPEAQYTMLIKTLWLYPGYNVGIGKEPPKITAVITVYETANPSNILLKVLYDKSIGIDPPAQRFTAGNRIAGAYEKLAKNITMQLRRFVK